MGKIEKIKCKLGFHRCIYDNLHPENRDIHKGLSNIGTVRRCLRCGVIERYSIIDSSISDKTFESYTKIKDNNLYYLIDFLVFKSKYMENYRVEKIKSLIIENGKKH